MQIQKVGLEQSNLPIQLNAHWLVCEEECVPEEAQLTLDIPIDSEVQRSSSFDLIQKLLANTKPQSLPIQSIVTKAEKIELTLSMATVTLFDEVYFFSEQAGVVEAAAPQQFRIENGSLVLELSRGFAELPGKLSGLLEISSQGSIRYLNAIQAESSALPVKSTPSLHRPSLFVLLAMALLGGFILNAMPCVFPVLSFKALAIANHSSQSSNTIRLHALAYSGGVVLSFLAIGGLLLALKASGAALGWGFQMQSPLFISLLAYIMFLVGLNFSGVVEIRSAFGGGQDMAARQDWLGSAATGALATLVATPCTAPFMATALGAALVLPASQGMLIFVFLGLGLALPFVVLSWFPKLIHRLPRPGPWMVRFRQFLAFPMYLTALWLLWILGKQAGINAMALALAGMLGLVFVCWCWPLRPRNALSRGLLALVFFLFCLGPLTFLPLSSVELSNNNGYDSENTLTAQSFSQTTLKNYRDKGLPVFVYATASWCITCKVNEQVALHTDVVRNHFIEQNIIVLRADWTNSDPEITHYLQSFERSGVPIYVYYPPNAEPLILPQILTPSIIFDSTSST